MSFLLFSRRKRLKEVAEREAAGASFWTSSFDSHARTRILHVFRDLAGYHAHEIAAKARHLILTDEGLLHLMDPYSDEADDLLSYLLNCDDDDMPTVVEALYQGMAAYEHRDSSRWGTPKVFEEQVGMILREHRVSYDLIAGRMVEFSSKELHQSVVVPALTLLAGRSDLSAVEVAYHAALDEISRDSAGDAITDAGTALQEMLTALGCSGKSLGPLISSARTQGFLATHDSRLIDAITKLLHWVSADRSQHGDAHSSQDPPLEDAWLTVHVVGALIVRLAAPTRRAEVRSARTS